MPKLFTFARFAFLALAVLAVSVLAGTPLAVVSLIVGKVLASSLAGGLIVLLLTAAYLMEGRDATFPLTLVASRTFDLGLWLLSLALLWLVTLAVTPQACEVVTASVSVAHAVAFIAYRQFKAGSFWPSRTDGQIDRFVAGLKDVFAAVDTLAASRAPAVNEA